MMNKKVKLKMMCVFTLIMCVLLGNVVFADLSIMPPNVNPSLGDYTEQGNQLVRNFAGALSWIGYAIAVGMTVFIGIKYVIASADEKASMKGLLVKVVVGSVIIAMSSTLVLFLNSVLSISSGS